MLKKLIVILALLSLNWTLPAYADDDKALSGASTLGEIFGYISQFHLKQPDVEKLTQASIKGMLDELGDPYTVYFSPGELEEFSEELNGDFEGIGAELELRGQYPCIVRVLNNSPAEQVGLQKGDLIVAVEGKTVVGQPLYEVIDQLRGAKGTKVTVMVRREGQKDFPLEITRNTVDMPTVHDKVLESGIGYIAIDSFGMETGKEFGDSLKRLKENGIKALIIDLRNNGGGYVDAAAEIAGYLLGPDKIIFVTEDRNKRQDPYATDQDQLINSLPMVVLINGETASASEILAGALQDYGKAVLYGTVSYGKGTVQDIIPLENGGALKITTASYLTPKGRRINGIGLKPDLSITTPELQLYEAKQILTPVKREINFSKSTSVKVNQESFNAPSGFIKEEGKWYVPLRFTMEALGYEVNWNAQSNSIMIKKQEKSSALTFKAKNNLSYVSVEELRKLGFDIKLEGDNLTIKEN